MHSGKMCMDKFHWHKTRIQNLPRLGHLDLALSSIGKSILRGSLFFHRVDRGLPLCFCVLCRLLCVVPYRLKLWERCASVETQVDYSECGSDIDISGHWTESCTEQTGANSRDLHSCTGAKTADFAKKCRRVRRVSRSVNIESPSSSNNIGVIISVLLAKNWFWSFCGRIIFIPEKILCSGSGLLWVAPWDFFLAPQKKACQWQWQWKNNIN